MKLSNPQREFLEATRQADELMATHSMHHLCGRRDSGRAVSAWYRTAEALERKGFVKLSRCGNGYSATLTDKGRVYLGLRAQP